MAKRLLIRLSSARNIASDDVDGDDDDDDDENDRDEGKETDDDESDEDETVQDLIARQRAQFLEPVKKSKRKAKVSSNKTNTEEQERVQFKRESLADFGARSMSDLSSKQYALITEQWTARIIALRKEKLL